MGNGLKRVAKQCGGIAIGDVIYNKDGHLKHIVEEGGRFHVIYRDTLGEHCSEKNCEINYKCCS